MSSSFNADAVQGEVALVTGASRKHLPRPEQPSLVPQPATPVLRQFRRPWVIAGEGSPSILRMMSPCNQLSLISRRTRALQQFW